MKILIIKFRNIGDVLLTGPLASSLKLEDPENEIHVLVKAGTEAMIDGHPHVDMVHVYPRRRPEESRWQFFRREWRWTGDLRQRQFDMVINTTEGDRGTIVGYLAGGRRRLGLVKRRGDKLWRRLLLTTARLPLPGYRHTVLRNLDLLEHPAATPYRNVHLAFNGETLDNVQVLLHAAGWTDDRPLIQVHPTSRWFFKCWNDADMARVIDHLQTVHGYQAVITSGPDDKERDRVAGIIAQCNSMPLNLSGQLTLKQMAALTSLCDFYFGVDTAPMHMAAALNIPVIALFGPSGAFDWGPWPNGWTGNGTPYPQPNGIQYSHPHIVIQTDWECVPCGQDGCRGSKRSACLEKLSCTEVVRIVDEHIKQLKGETITVAHHTKPAAAPLVERRQKERFDSRSRCILNKGIRYYLGHFPITDGKKQILDLVRPLIMPANDKVSVQTKYGFELIVTLRNPEQERLYFYQDHDERYEVNNIRNIIKPGDVCWDIGANIGFYTCLFSILTGAPGKVVAFEPVRATLRFLSANVAINRLHNVVVISKALGDRRETREIFYRTPDTAEGTASFRTSIGSYSEQVEIDTVDHLYNGLNLPDFIKIDVEGYQTEVLNGARRFLKHHQPLVMLEVRERDQDATEGLEAYLRELGYMLFGFRKHSLYECKTLKDVRRRNVLLVKPGTPYFERIAGLLSGN